MNGLFYFLGTALDFGVFLFLLCKLVIPVNQINDYFYHHILFFRSAFRNHQGQGNERIIPNQLGTVGLV